MKPNPVDDLLDKVYYEGYDQTGHRIDDIKEAKQLLLAEMLKALPEKRGIANIETGSELVRTLGGGSVNLKAQKLGFNQAIDQASQALTRLIMGVDK